MNRRVLNTKSVMLRFMFKKTLFPTIGTARVYQHLAADNFNLCRGENQSGLLTFIHPGSHKKYSLLLPYCYIPNQCYTFLTNKYQYSDYDNAWVIRLSTGIYRVYI